ncbi:MAG: M13 family metallopeptidase [Steroidobacteraceae bacterium]
MNLALLRPPLFAVLLGASISAHAAAPALPASAPAAPSPGIDLAGIDRSIVPGDDFFRYANGAWLQATEIPADRKDYGVGAMLFEEASRRTADLIRGVGAAHPRPGSEQRKIADYFASFVDEAAIERRGMRPLAPTLARIAAIRDRHALARYLGGTLRADVDAINNTNFYTDNVLGLWVAQDLDDPTRYAAFLLQGGLGLPDREYYLDPAPRMAQIRDRYRTHLATMLRLAGRPATDPEIERIVELEIRIAQAHSSREESIDIKRGDNHWTRADFDRRAPGLDWSALFAAARLAGERQFVVWHPHALQGLAALATSEPLDLWRAYLTVHALDHYAPFLPSAFVDEHFAFYGKVLSGTPALQARWKRGVNATNAALGDAVGKLYAERWFPSSEKRRAEEMVRNLIAAFGERIDRLDWMASATRARAKEKLAVLKVGVGYPDHPRDYRRLDVVRGDAFGNAVRAELFNYDWNLAKLGTAVDRDEWVMTAQTVNAVNLPAMNAINFPAAILQPPYFDPQRPVSMDYGAIGATIGHEISHSFDDQGALFDAAGRLRNWWTPADFEHFQSSGARLAAQYSAYKPFADLAVNGNQTLSENIADVAGLAVAFDGFQRSAARAGAPVVAGYSPEQQFFLSFAQSWRQKVREPSLRQRMLTDGHAPAEYRADTVRNLDAWYTAFEVRPGQALFLAPEQRVRIW